MKPEGKPLNLLGMQITFPLVNLHLQGQGRFNEGLTD